MCRYGMMVAVMVLSFVLLFVLFCIRKLVPWNYIALLIFTLLMSYSIGVIGTLRFGVRTRSRQRRWAHSMPSTRAMPGACVSAVQ